ncbi:exonuclease domain-containing protein [Vibrio algivorus]|uniref:DNA polymerase III subunit epsilon n=1 Tax=Vibrio algivorus TaxID=1667024 RepID=A0ABQ6ERL8_9VIBR|nr:exonuclease domain-containing protein [Vibrio algivorus]GLT15270.1 DNA polymerase III subunit epsilon [Vibrio algivorus]
MFENIKSQLFGHPLTKIEDARKRISINEQWPDGLRQLLSYPVPKLGTPIDSLHYLALDFETTGLNPLKSSILSIGTVPLYKSKIDVEMARHVYLNRSDGISSESAVINHIVPEMLEGGHELDQTMDKLFEMMRGKVVLVHGAVVEKQFIDHYVQQKFGIAQLPIVWIDTLKIEKCLTYIQHPETCSYQLTDVRLKHHLPAYPAHNALIDAISCAELYLAQIVNIFGHREHEIKLEEIFNKQTVPVGGNAFG